MRISILIYDGFTMLDAVGGYSVLGWLPGAEVEFVAERKTIVADDLRSGGLAAWRDYSEVKSTDILYVPGGPGARPQMTNETTLAFVRRLHESSTWTFSVCNGAEILAAAGILTRVGVIVRHRPLGWSSNAMVAFDLPEDEIAAAGPRLAALPGITLCYQRRTLPDVWRWGLFCMIHARSRPEALQILARARALPELAGADHQILFSQRCFKQTGATLSRQETP